MGGYKGSTIHSIAKGRFLQGGSLPATSSAVAPPAEPFTLAHDRGSIAWTAGSRAGFTLCIKRQEALDGTQVRWPTQTLCAPNAICTWRYGDVWCVQILVE